MKKSLLLLPLLALATTGVMNVGAEQTPTVLDAKTFYTLTNKESIISDIEYLMDYKGAQPVEDSGFLTFKMPDSNLKSPYIINNELLAALKAKLGSKSVTSATSADIGKALNEIAETPHESITPPAPPKMLTQEEYTALNHKINFSNTLTDTIRKALISTDIITKEDYSKLGATDRESLLASACTFFGESITNLPSKGSKLDLSRKGESGSYAWEFTWTQALGENALKVQQELEKYNRLKQKWTATREQNKNTLEGTLKLTNLQLNDDLRNALNDLSKASQAAYTKYSTAGETGYAEYVQAILPSLERITAKNDPKYDAALKELILLAHNDKAAREFLDKLSVNQREAEQDFTTRKATDTDETAAARTNTPLEEPVEETDIPAA